VFLSTIKVNGESTEPGTPFTAADAVSTPEDPYALSKWQAEQSLQLAGPGMQTIVIRSPLVYGPDVSANFLRLVRAVDRGVPLPVRSVENRRSLIGLSNLADAIRIAANADVSGVFLVSDGEGLSTPELIRRIARELHKPARLAPLPVWLLSGLARLAGKQDDLNRLVGSLEVDITSTCEILDWSLPCSVDEELARTIAWYRAEGGG
jgi:nucleoside-diphosphate-sugar epimerase